MRQPRNKKEAAVDQWKDSLEELPEGEEWARTILEADIHDRRDRIDIEETIHHEVPEEYFGLLEDTFHDLKLAFEEMWS